MRWLALVVLALAASGCWHDDAPPPESPVPTVSTGQSGGLEHASVFIPATERDGDRTLMPLVFPDGKRAVASYPRPLRLSRLGAQPDVTYFYRGRPGARFAATFVHGPAETRAGELALRTESWTILVPFGSDRGEEIVRGNLNARETSLGFPVLTASGPLVLSNAYGEGGGSMLALGDRTPAPQIVSSLDPLVEIAPVDRCRVDVEIGGGYGANCFGDIFVNVTGKPRFVRELFGGLRIEER